MSALLNSSVVSFWLKKKGKMQGSNFQIDKEPLMEIPLHAPCNDIQTCMSRLVSLVISLTHSNMLDVAKLYDNVINLMIAQLYFEEEFANHDIDLISLILDSELKDLDPKDIARYHSKAIDFANKTLLSPSKISEAVNDAFEISDINTIFNA